ncbi:MAG TPA: NAD-dependent epimerase/dehydratase family protein [Candidatus Dormibacteraeota bacterium]
MSKKVLVTGAGGFIGHHLAARLVRSGDWVRGVDIKEPEFEGSHADDFRVADLRDAQACREAVDGVDEIYHLAADMGGMGFISSHHTQILHNNSMIDLNMFAAAHSASVQRIFYSSSACIYPEGLQEHADMQAGLKESDAYPAQPQDACGWQKLMTERMAMYYRHEHRLESTVARFHNVFGPLGTWRGGREKAPAAMCRKVATAKLTGDAVVEIWGDGEQTRSFCYIDDCVEGIYRIMNSGHHEPLNLGSDEMVSINQLVDLVADIAGVQITKRHIDGPQGVRGRNSDNTLMRDVLGWEPPTNLKAGLRVTYAWIEERVKLALATDQVDYPLQHVG